MAEKPLVQSISDTARWVAAYRARETERPDALFRDPYAGKLAGELGARIMESLGPGGRHDWAFVVRTVAFDELIATALSSGVDTVINLAAGLDTRPYRMKLPSRLRWFEIDLPEIVTHKERALANARPNCRLTRVPLDLRDRVARKRFFAEVEVGSQETLVISEGLIVYLEPPDVAQLADDLAAQRSFRFWITDLASPGLLRLLQREYGHHLSEGKAPLKFAPGTGVAFFEPYGWHATAVRSNVKDAVRLRRGPFFLRLFALFPEKVRNPGRRPWGGTILLERT